jgi:hypothetical protein
MRLFAAWLRRVLAGERIVAWTVLLTALLSSHVLFQGWLADDHALRGLTLRIPPWTPWRESPLELFTFWDGEPTHTLSLVDRGFATWWTDLHLRIMFFRPLTALTHWVDFHVGSPVLAHAQSVAWYLAVVAAAGALYRRVLGRGWAAGLAVFMFALDTNHAVLIEWISNRNALVAGLFGLGALLLQDRAARSNARAKELLSAVCLALGLAGGEVALGAAAYVAAYALCLEDRPLRARVLGLLPHAAVLLAWVVVYRSGHYGAHGSGVYVDPGDSPLAFARQAAVNVPILLQGELGGFPPDLLALADSIPKSVVALALVLVAVPLVALLPLRSDGRAKFFLVGALLSTVPAAATFPSSRLVLFPSLGLLGLVAMVVEGVVERAPVWRAGPVRWGALYTAVWIGGRHFFLSPLAIHVPLRQMAILERVIARFGEGLGDDPALARRRVVVVNAPDPFFTYYMIAMRVTAGRVTPASMLVLAGGQRAVDVERTDESTVVVREDRGFYRHGTELLTRSLLVPLPEGSRVPLTGVTVEVTRTGADGVPTEAAFHFARPLEDEGLQWMTWRGRALVPFELPRVGEKRHIDAQVPQM